MEFWFDNFVTLLKRFFVPPITILKSIWWHILALEFIRGNAKWRGCKWSRVFGRPMVCQTHQLSALSVHTYTIRIYVYEYGNDWRWLINMSHACCNVSVIYILCVYCTQLCAIHTTHACMHARKQNKKQTNRHAMDINSLIKKCWVIVIYLMNYARLSAPL